VKIAIITEQYPPALGGIATSAQRVARNLALLGAEVQVFCFDSTKPMDASSYVIVENDGLVRIRRVGPFFLAQPQEVKARLTEKDSAVARRQVVDKMIEVLSAEPPDALLSFYLLNAGFVAQFVGAALDVPVVACVRGTDIGHNIFRLDRFAASDWVVRRANAVACVNEHLRRRLLWTWPEAAIKTVVIPNSVAVIAPPTDADAPDSRARTDLGWPHSAFVLVFVGVLREKKGVAALVSALATLGERDVRLLVVGPDIGRPEREVCGTAWDELRHAGKLFSTGRLARDEVASWLQGADAVVMPSLDDGMANGLLEGMALGLCPVVTDVFLDVVTDGVDGVVVRRGDATDLANAIGRLVDDPISRKRLAARAQRRVAEWSPEMEARAYLELLSSVQR
jgi:glycosyltransferase involved in cell wall biosynthesis